MEYSGTEKPLLGKVCYKYILYHASIPSRDSMTEYMMLTFCPLVPSVYKVS